MTSLYTEESVIGKLWKWFLEIFSEECKFRDGKSICTGK